LRLLRVSERKKRRKGEKGDFYYISSSPASQIGACQRSPKGEKEKKEKEGRARSASRTTPQ